MSRRSRGGKTTGSMTTPRPSGKKPTYRATSEMSRKTCGLCAQRINPGMLIQFDRGSIEHVVCPQRHVTVRQIQVPTKTFRVIRTM